MKNINLEEIGERSQYRFGEFETIGFTGQKFTSAPETNSLHINVKRSAPPHSSGGRYG
jgi:hypothetical protein